MEFSDGLWRKSSFSTDQAECVEIAYPATTPTVGIRDSKNPTAGHLTLPHTALHHLTHTITTSGNRVSDLR